MNIKDSGDRTRVYKKHHPGERISKITLVKRLQGGQKWEYICDCGSVGVCQPSSTSGMCPECSKKERGLRQIKHGESPGQGKQASRLYRIWLGIKTRCLNPNNHSYKNYGARGIDLCKEWQEYLPFKEWALSTGYSDNLSIDRINVDGPYSPENCRWADAKTQGRNRRNTISYELNGNQYSMSELADLYGIPYSVLKGRLRRYKWSVEEAISIPVKMGNNQNTRGVYGNRKNS